MGEEIYYLAGKLLAIVVTAVWLFETADIGILVIRMLVFGCLFALQLLLSQIKEGRWKKWSRLCQIAALIWALLMGIGQSFIIVVVVSMELLDGLAEGSLFYEIGGVVLLLLWFVYQPERQLLLLAAVFTVLLLLIRYTEKKRQLLWKTNLEQRAALARMQEKLDEMKSYARTIQDAAVVEERNRFAARIHDKLGHSISGSIILLEATALSLDKDPHGAKKNIAAVTENLRNGVDEIRMALRQERPERSRLGVQEIKKTLEEFQVTYGRKTSLETSGDLEKISMPVWICVQENLKEALTNMLKHSEGTAFTMRIESMNRTIRVEYADNGSCLKNIIPGMGLQAIEERTAACGGTAVFHGGQGGFSIVTVYL